MKCNLEFSKKLSRGLLLFLIASHPLIGAVHAEENSASKAPPKDADSAKPAAAKKSGKSFSGNVSWYGAQFNGKKTACGDIFDMNKKTAAHKTLPFHTKVLVEDPKTGQSVVVVVNDRGPFVKTRVMDLSRGGAVALGTIHKGVATVDCTVIDKD